uniref:Immunoglobulin I-set domain-containing protein n=1 Tax=Leptobrachium leishanense TaxID=445787 RepID=A0A8C5LSM6_9ANUR
MSTDSWDTSLLVTTRWDTRFLGTAPCDESFGDFSVKATEILAAEGESVTFQTDFSGPRTEVVWKIGEDKLVEVEENYTHYYRLADRASVSFHSGSLTIRELVESDSGHYSGNILTERRYHETKFILKVSRKYRIRTICTAPAPAQTDTGLSFKSYTSVSLGRPEHEQVLSKTNKIINIYFFFPTVIFFTFHL